MLSDKIEDIKSDVERQMQEDPLPGTVQYSLLQMVDGTNLTERPPVELRGVDDEHKFKYGQRFVRNGLAYLRARDAFPQGPLALTKAELNLLEQCLHVASMTYQFHSSPDGSRTEHLSGRMLKQAMLEEQEEVARTGRESMLSNMPGIAALALLMRQTRDAIPTREEAVARDHS